MARSAFWGWTGPPSCRLALACQCDKTGLPLSLSFHASHGKGPFLCAPRRRVTHCPRPMAKACSGTKSQGLVVNPEPKEAPPRQEQVWGGGGGEAGWECDPHLSGYLEGEAWRCRKEAQVGREHRVWVRGLLPLREEGVITQPERIWGTGWAAQWVSSRGADWKERNAGEPWHSGSPERRASSSSPRQKMDWHLTEVPASSAPTAIFPWDDTQKVLVKLLHFRKKKTGAEGLSGPTLCLSDKKVSGRWNQRPECTKGKMSSPNPKYN